MMLNMIFFVHAFLAFDILVLDRVSKWLALNYCIKEQSITSFLSCNLTFNRGISWGMLHDANSMVFTLVTVLIACITAFITYLAIMRLREGLWSIAYICVAAGSLSNL